ncbi:MAG: DPP IV N-terminal domain-containing protein [Phycisphaeraceae bacterium]
MNTLLPASHVSPAPFAPATPTTPATPATPIPITPAAPAPLAATPRRRVGVSLAALAVGLLVPACQMTPVEPEPAPEPVAAAPAPAPADATVTFDEPGGGLWRAASDAPPASAPGLYGHLAAGHVVAADGPAAGASEALLENLHQITFTGEGSDFDPAISPDGEQIVFASTRHREASNLYIKQISGATLTQLTNDRANDVTPAFSPDGERIAFASDRGGHYDIYIMDVSGGQPIQITRSETHDLHPSFSPDGRHLVYAAFGGPSAQWELIVVDLENPSRKQYVGTGLFPNWSPVDGRILFQRPRQRGSRQFSVWTIDYQDGEAVSPTEIVASHDAALITPRWSPDGEFVVFCTIPEGAADDASRPTHADVWIVGADGNGRVRLTEGRFANLQPVWAQDGTIYFVSNRARVGDETIWAVRPDRALRLARPGSQADPAARAEW